LGYTGITVIYSYKLPVNYRDTPVLSRLPASFINYFTRLTTGSYVRVLLQFTLMFNPYVTQISRQTGMSESEVRRTSKRSTPTLDYVQRLGFDTVQDYLDELHEFLNGN
jgi:uncharacterized membrane protein